jgi:hypothetical protein
VPKITVHGGPTIQTFPPDQEERTEVEPEPVEDEVPVDEDGNPIVDEVEVDEDGNPVEDDVPVDSTPDAVFGLQAHGDADVVSGPDSAPPVDKPVDVVKDWVGDDYVKADRALAAERAGRNRSGLVSWLEKVAASR